MAILGVALIRSIDIGTTNPTKVNLSLEVVGIAPGQPVGAQPLLLVDQSVTVTGTTFEVAIKAAVKAYLTASWLYSFGLLDDVILIGATLI